MSRATPDLTQGFTGVSLPKTGPRQMGTDADGKTSVITFLNQVTESAASLHDNQTDTRPDYLPVNGLWCYTAPDGTKTVYQYDGTTDVELWTVAGGKSSVISDALPILIPLPVPFSTVQTGFLSVTVDNGVLTEASYPDAYAQLVAMQAAGETNIVTMVEYAAEMTAQGGVCGRFALDTDAQTFRIPCAPGAFWRGASASKAVGDYGIDTMRPITGVSSGRTADVGMYSKDTANAVYTGVFTRAIGVGAANINATVGGQGSDYMAINSALLGPNYSGTETAPMHIVTDYQMKIR